MNDVREFRLDFDWLDPGAAKCAELRASWASLSISIMGQPVSEVLDCRTRSVRRSIFLPLFPLAEWIADNWWFLNAEIEGPNDSSPIGFDRRHNFRWAREGFVLPSISFVTLGQNISLEWQQLDFQDAGIRFLSSGNAILRTRSVLEEMREFVNAVISRLDDSGVTGTTLHEQWAAIENADSEEREFCCAAARLGSDPYAIDDEGESKILAAAETVRPELFDDFMSLADAGTLSVQASSLNAASESIEADTDALDALAAVRARAPSLNEQATPWEAGYQFAAQLRSALSGESWKSRSLEFLAGHLGIDYIDHCLLPKTIDGLSLDVLVGTNQHRNPKFILEKSWPSSRQFSFCRALFEHLTLPHGQFAAVSRLRTERQQMNRAFAAEFLAPHAMLKSDLSATTVGEEEIEELAVDYGVSAFVIRHQIENHGLANVTP